MRRTVARDLTIADTSRTYERIQALKRVHRQAAWEEALYLYPDVRKGLIDIRNRFPGLSETENEVITTAIARLQFMETFVESTQSDASQIPVSDFNEHLIDIEVTLAELGAKLHESR